MDNVLFYFIRYLKMKRSLFVIFVLGLTTLLLTGCMTQTSDEVNVDETVSEDVVLDDAENVENAENVDDSEDTNDDTKEIEAPVEG